MTILLIRHASTTGQAADAPLTEAGFAQAEALVPVLTDLHAGPLYTSPFTRARQTLAPYANHSDQDVGLVDDMRERLLSPTPLEDPQSALRASFEDPTFACPGGESLAELRTRGWRGLTEIAQAGGSLPTVVSHGGMISALFSACDPSFDFDASRALQNPDLFRVKLSQGHVTAFTRLELEMHR